MKKLKDIIAKAKETKKVKTLDYDSSFGAFRDDEDDNKPKVKTLDYDSSFGAFRDDEDDSGKSVKESIHHGVGDADGEEMPEDSMNKLEKKLEANALVNSHKFYHPEIRVNEDQGMAIDHYSKMGSSMINDSFRRGQDLHWDDEAHVAHLDSMFDENDKTNKTTIHTYSGLPTHIGDEIHTMKPGDVAHFPGYVSTSANRAVAHRFAHRNPAKQCGGHMLKIEIPPGHGVNIAHHSSMPDEHEVLLKHGTQMKYNGTTVTAKGTHVHHMTVVPK